MPSTARLLTELVLARHFATASFDSFRPDPAHPVTLHPSRYGALLGGRGTDGLFTDAMLRGGYRKTYLRPRLAGSSRPRRRRPRAASRGRGSRRPRAAALSLPGGRTTSCSRG